MRGIPATAPPAERWRTRTRSRRLGYALLGDAFSYLLHLRPREWPIMAAHTALGFVLALGLREPWGREAWLRLSGALLLWVVCLNGGTLALNSAFDHDTGDIGYLDSPPPPPRHLAVFGVALMGLGQALALLFGPRFAVAYAICFVMSLAYSVPPLRLKAVGGVDWLINMVGFGTLTPFAGWSASGRPLDAAGAWVLAGFCPLFAALYPLTQLYQFDEDSQRGDRTLAIIVGVRTSLIIAVACTLLAFVCFARAASILGGGVVRSTALVVALIAWLAVLLPWMQQADAYSVAQHKRGMYLALGAWALTDVAIVVAVAV
jgi:4-hydroxybenzoate polyprenyltransferase